MTVATGSSTPTTLYDEEAPLLLAAGAKQHQAVYDRFTKSQKRVILFLISWAGLIPFFLFGSFIPSIPQVADELGSTPAIISSTISVSTLASAFGALFWGQFSGYYGRKAVYLFSSPCLIVGSLGSGLAQNVSQLVVFRFIQAFGAGSSLSIGSAVVGDIYRLEERGGAMGIFLAIQMVGPSAGPILGGLATHYASWRWMQIGLFFASCITFALIWQCFPETSHPNTLGIDKTEQETGVRRKFVFINPFNSLALLRSPVIVIICLIGTCTLYTDFVLWVPLPYTIGERYGITNETWVGACFLPSAAGNLIAAPFIGKISDRIVKKYAEARGGKWVPEDRLNAAKFGGVFLVPVSVVLAGFASAFIDNRPLGIFVSLVALLMNGLGVVAVMAVLQAYIVDVLHSQSAEASSAYFGVRSILCSIITLGIMPSIEHLGVWYTDLLCAAFAWIGYALLMVLLLRGDKLRAWVDIGYTTSMGDN
ncbi:MFS general substrate transporter [Coniophora puteana RWD-64-598 SS2]|uniref:MFS general substrate transporter n=1 Tax=Coniophora puteana (strain RWD-64-598) TaxID=741705 RepID=A0A5M3N2V2_CONPW|nr:MFS general substrate transporter [Coniophora puteana RWD-64-598 SS2]EIW85698.1 MFS general substrate transporter [Coniophora puteana RWD-64-598 SS2]